MLPKVQIYDITNPQGVICQSKADVKCKQHLALLKTIYSLPGFLWINCSASMPVTTCHSRKAHKKRTIKELNDVSTTSGCYYYHYLLPFKGVLNLLELFKF